MSRPVPTFKTGPSPDQLRAMDRDLRFHPSTTRNPSALTHEQIASFNRDGYLKGLRIFDDVEIAARRRYFDRLLADTMAAGGTSYSISSAHLKCGRVYDLMRHPRLVACAQDILGREIVGLASHFFCKMPYDPVSISWHQDASFWPLTPSKTVTIWLAIDDADRENSCMRFVAGSHRHGHLPYRQSGEEENTLFNQTALDVEKYGRVRGCGAEGGGDLDALRPLVAQLGSQSLGPPALRSDPALLRHGGAGPARIRLGRGRRWSSAAWTPPATGGIRRAPSAT